MGPTPALDLAIESDYISKDYVKEIRFSLRHLAHFQHLFWNLAHSFSLVHLGI